MASYFIRLLACAALMVGLCQGACDVAPCPGYKLNYNFNRQLAGRQVGFEQGSYFSTASNNTGFFILSNDPSLPSKSGEPIVQVYNASPLPPATLTATVTNNFQLLSFAYKALAGTSPSVTVKGCQPNSAAAAFTFTGSPGTIEWDYVELTGWNNLTSVTFEATYPFFYLDDVLTIPF